MQYVDLLVSKHGGQPIQRAASEVLRLLHNIFTTTQYRGRYALSLPVMAVDTHKGHPMSVIRVFCREPSEMENLVRVMENSTMKQFARMKMVRTVPEDFAGQYVSFKRFRVIKRKEGRPEARLTQLNYASENSLPYFKVRSTTNKHHFSVTVTTQVSSGLGEWSPDSFGLGSRFSLPVLPV